MASLYDRAEIYDLIENEERFNIIKKHWETLFEGKDIRTFLDVSIGSGSLSLPVCELGVTLYGSDLSEAMLERCKAKAEKRGFSPVLKPCDFRKLKSEFSETFDCVASTGNSLPYVNNDELLSVLENMDSLIRPGGYLYFDMRNWDKILKDRQRFYTYNPFFVDDTRVNLVQLWDYNNDGSMDFNILYTFEQNLKIVQKEIFTEHYYPIAKSLIENKLAEMNYTDVSVYLNPAQFGSYRDDCSWYTVMARKSE